MLSNCTTQKLTKNPIEDRIGSDLIILIMTFVLFSCFLLGVLDFFYIDPVIYVIYLLYAITTLGFASSEYNKTRKHKYKNVHLITLYYF